MARKIIIDHSAKPEVTHEHVICRIGARLCGVQFNDVTIKYIGRRLYQDDVEWFNEVVYPRMKNEHANT